VSSVHSYWILPNRNQRDDVLACDGGRIVPLRQILEPRLRPEGFSHGVPTELLERCGPAQSAQVVFAQRFPRWQGNRQLFVVTTPAGVDSSGRVVHLGVLFILEPHEHPSFDIPYADLPGEDQPHAQVLLRRLSSPKRGDSWAQSVRELGELARRYGPATNVALQRSAIHFHSLYEVAPGGLTRKLTARKRSLLLLLVFAVIGIGLAERACRHSPRPLVLNGAPTCRFS